MEKLGNGKLQNFRKYFPRLPMMSITYSTIITMIIFTSVYQQKYHNSNSKKEEQPIKNKQQKQTKKNMK